MAAPLNLVGSRYNRLTVVGIDTESSKPGRGRRWICVCDCGKQIGAYTSSLNSGHTKSCGCLQLDHARKVFFKHGRHGTPTNVAWAAMLSRCRDKNNISYANYGGRGIKVCDRWHEFSNFLTDMGEKPSPKHSLDRWPNNNGDYEPGNCRWATKEEQDNNKRTSRFFTINGRTQTMMQWSRELGINYKTLTGRYEKTGSFEKVKRSKESYHRKDRR